MREETGFGIGVVGEPVHVRRARFEFEGSVYDQSEYFFVARVEGLQVEDSGWTGVERRVVVEHRWWTPAELRSTGETLHPGELADLLAGVLDHEDREGFPRRGDRAGHRRNAQRWASTAARAVAGRGEDPGPGGTRSTDGPSTVRLLGGTGRFRPRRDRAGPGPVLAHGAVTT